MARDKVSEWSSTAAQNTVIADININEGCPPSTINNAIRELMAQVKDFQQGADGDGLTVATLNVVGTATLGNIQIASFGAITATSANVSGGIAAASASISGALTTATLNVSGATVGTTGTFNPVITDTVLEKTSAAGVTIDGLLVKDGGVVNPTVTNYTETVSSTTGSTTINLSNGTLFKVTTNGDNTITLPSSSSGKSFIIIVAYGGAHTITWAGGSTIKWAFGSAPTQTKANGKFDIFSFFQDGTNTYGGAFGTGF
jgi:hypothetical protein